MKDDKAVRVQAREDDRKEEQDIWTRIRIAKPGAEELKGRIQSRELETEDSNQKGTRKVQQTVSKDVSTAHLPLEIEREIVGFRVPRLD